MNDNNYIEIRQRTEELMRQAYLIWQSSDYAEHFERLDDDPVFRMLMTAMAYQFRGIDSDIEFMKQEVVKDKVHTTYFVDGSLAGENPVLLAFVSDESGINTTGAGIGHDIIATLTGAAERSYNLNDCFVSEPGNPGKGTINYKMLDLPDGDYTLTLKVWDIYNNSNTAEIHFTVANSLTMQIENPFNVPNPVSEATGFVFEHNQIGNNMDVQVYIYDIMGRLVRQLSEQVMGSSTRVEPIRWDGRNAQGEALSNGIYVYRIVATNDKGETAAVTSKLLICR